MSYTFVLKNGGWWLKVSSLEELVDYYKTTNQNYAVRCQARSDGQTMIDLTLSVKTKEQAEAICNNWRKQHEDVYMYLMDSLMQ